MAAHKTNMVERFWSKVDVRGPDECWPWLAGVDKKDGYGQFWIDYRNFSAHGVAWRLKNGPMSPGMVACHSCDVRYPAGDKTYRRCCNPDHVFPGTSAENLAERVIKGRQAKGDRINWKLYPELALLTPRGMANGHAKLTTESVIAIRAAIAAGERQRIIAKRYGVGQSAISAIGIRKTWAHVK